MSSSPYPEAMTPLATCATSWQPTGGSAVLGAMDLRLGTAALTPMVALTFRPAGQSGVTVRVITELFVLTRAALSRMPTDIGGLIGAGEYASVDVDGRDGLTVQVYPSGRSVLAGGRLHVADEHAIDTLLAADLNYCLRAGQQSRTPPA